MNGAALQKFQTFFFEKCNLMRGAASPTFQNVLREVKWNEGCRISKLHKFPHRKHFRMFFFEKCNGMNGAAFLKTAKGSADG
jgi:hypothetical protein